MLKFNYLAGMSNVRISQKGKALLRKAYSSAAIARAIVQAGDKLSTQEGLTVIIDNKPVKVRAAVVSAR